MSRAYLVLGVLLLVVVVVDLLWTTLWVEGSAGPLTAGLMAIVWRSIRRVWGHNPKVLSLSGPSIFVIGLTMWIVLLWAGWTLVFAGAEGVLVDVRDADPITWSDRIYFTGYSIFTLGNGDFTPGGAVWQLATVLATASGMLFVTMIVTYVLSVLDAVTQKRAFASGVAGIGGRGDEIVRAAWDGEGFRGLDLSLNTYVSQLNTLTANHHAYPILHYFHSESHERAPVTSVAALDEALTVLRFGVSERGRPAEPILRNARSSVESYLETLNAAFIEPADEPPPPPNLDALRDAGIPTVSDGEFAGHLDELDERRRTLLGLVESDVRKWPSGGG